MAVEIQGLAPLLQVFDMPASIRFYRDVLGFAMVSTSEPGDDCDWAWLRLNGVELMLNTAYERDRCPPAPDSARIAAHADTILYFGCPDVEGTYEQLRERGVTHAPPSTAPYGMRQLYIRDPDGYGICFQWKAD